MAIRQCTAKAFRGSKPTITTYVVEAMSDVPIREAYASLDQREEQGSYLNKLVSPLRACAVAPREVTEFRRATATIPGRFTMHF